MDLFIGYEDEYSEYYCKAFNLVFIDLTEYKIENLYIHNEVIRYG